MNIDNIRGNDPTLNIESLTEISDLTFEAGSLVLRVDDSKLAKKFHLSGKAHRYEFDGYKMFFYENNDDNIDHYYFSCSCGADGYTLVDGTTSRTIKEVKEEMIKQIMLKNMLNILDDDKDFKEVAIELNAFWYDNNDHLHLRKEYMKDYATA